MRTFESEARALLYSYALFPQQIDSIMEYHKNHESNEPMKDRWSDNVEGYPSQMIAVNNFAIASSAIEWLETNLSKAWMIPALKSFIGK